MRHRIRLWLLKKLDGVPEKELATCKTQIGELRVREYHLRNKLNDADALLAGLKNHPWGVGQHLEDPTEYGLHVIVARWMDESHKRALARQAGRALERKIL